MRGRGRGRGRVRSRGRGRVRGSGRGRGRGQGWGQGSGELGGRDVPALAGGVRREHVPCAREGHRRKAHLVRGRGEGQLRVEGWLRAEG